jgi:hypothetical protein
MLPTIYNVKSSIISIKGIDKVQLLYKLWIRGNQYPSNVIYPSSKMYEEDPMRVIQKGPIDYFCCVSIRTDLRGDEVDTWRYNVEHGDWAFENVVESFKK